MLEQLIGCRIDFRQKNLNFLLCPSKGKKENAQVKFQYVLKELIRIK